MKKCYIENCKNEFELCLDPCCTQRLQLYCEEHDAPAKLGNLALQYALIADLVKEVGVLRDKVEKLEAESR